MCAGQSGWKVCGLSIVAVVMLALAFVSSAVPQVSANSRGCEAYSGLPKGEGETAGTVYIPGGLFTMGSEHHQPEEKRLHTVRVDGFWIDRHEVTNAQFRRFVEATGYITLAERGVDPKTHRDLPPNLLRPGSVVFIKPTEVHGGRLTQWWQYVAGANWRHPQGPGSSIAENDNHPVVHIAYEDALAYARWLGRELPTEAQWEFAARGGREGEDDWSSAFDAAGKPIANTWQGLFPALNTEEDGYAASAPVGCFPPNGYGLFDMIGNVWEWTTDWYRPGHPHVPAINPTGPPMSTVTVSSGQSPQRVIKGGSYLCAHNYCARYRPAARQPQEVDLGTAHLGFRTVLKAGQSGDPK